MIVMIKFRLKVVLDRSKARELAKENLNQIMKMTMTMIT